MDLSITSATAIERIASAMTELAQAVETDALEHHAEAVPSATTTVPHADATTALVQGGFVERVLGEAHTDTAAVSDNPHVEHVDRGPETAALQTLARPHPQVAERAVHADQALPVQQHGHSDFAMPAALLVPTALIGLQVEHAATWPAPARGFDPDPAPLQEARVRDREAPPPPIEQGAEDEDAPPQDDIETSPGPAAEAEHDCAALCDDEDDGAWCERLTRALQTALAVKAPPPALLGAAEQWRRGRCVVLACPQGNDPGGPAWAFVLWPRRRAARRVEGAEPALALFGLRVEARLQWSTRFPGSGWHQVRAIKEHHPRTGRQLVPAAADPSGRVACEVQLGPVLARTLRRCDVCLRVNAVRRFWNALGAQWSMHVVVCAHPLLDAPFHEEDIR